MPFPRPARAALLAAILLSVTLLAPPARAEMTEAGRPGQRAFTACLNKTVGNEEACLLKLGYQAWYPYGGAACEFVAARIDSALTTGNQAEWEYLFRNERCARLNLPHDTAAAKAGNATAAEESEIAKSSPYVSCEKEPRPQDICLELIGRHTWYPVYPSCHMLDDILEGDPQLYSWKLLFFNERCWRLGLPHIRPAEQ